MLYVYVLLAFANICFYTVTHKPYSTYIQRAYKFLQNSKLLILKYICIQGRQAFTYHNAINIIHYKMMQYINFNH